MMINVPFYRSEKDIDCGPIALKMALEYLGEEHSMEEISILEKRLKSGLVWSTGIALASEKLGFPARFISISNFIPEDIEYYKKYADDKSKLILKEIQDELKNLGAKMEERNIALSELLNYVSENSVPIVLLDWHVISGKEGYQGHYVPVTGYDDENVYVHNPGIANAMAFMPIKREVFLKAWEAKGTDKDTIIIYKK